MKWQSPLSVHLDDLDRFDDIQAQNIFGELLEQEAKAYKIPLTKISCHQRRFVKDGGIDAEIRDVESHTSFILPGSSCFQIKSKFKSIQDCIKEIHIKNRLDNDIKPDIKKRLNEGYRYVQVYFSDITEAVQAKIRADFEEHLKNYGHKKDQFDLLVGNQICSILNQYKNLVAKIKNIEHCFGYEAWAENDDIKEPKKFVYDEERNSQIEEIQDYLLSSSDKCKIIRVTGLPGIGKTRFVFEALSSNELKSSVLYSIADKFIDSQLFDELQNDTSLSVILVVDECDSDMHEIFRRVFASRGPRISLITISSEISRVDEPTELICLNPLSHDKIKEVIEDVAPSIPDDLKERISRFADGYPRIAIILAKNILRDNIDNKEILEIRDERLFERLMGIESPKDNSNYQQTINVLTGIALFRKIGFCDPVINEAKWLADVFNVNWETFKSIVATHKGRKIIQGEIYIYLTPFMLRVFLIRKWWNEQITSATEFLNFVNKFPEEIKEGLFQRFIEHMKYIHDTQGGKIFIQEVLSQNGIFGDGLALKSEIGSRFFRVLSEADPKAALECLMRTIGKWGKEELLNFHVGRREIICALEKIAVWKEYFHDAARLLLLLAESENEKWSNNASGIFVGLFSPGPGLVSPTEMPLRERFLILQEALVSKSKEKRKLAIQACGAALHTGQMFKLAGLADQGLKKLNLWHPTRSELGESYRHAWEFLHLNIEKLPDDEKKEAAKILVDNSRGISRLPSMTEIVINTIDDIFHKAYLNDKEIIAAVERIKYYDYKYIPQPAKELWDGLYKKIVGDDFSSRLRRYVGLSLLEDRVQNYGSDINNAHPEIVRLAKEACQDPDKLEKKLDWLVTSDAENGFVFGKILGQVDSENFFQTKIIDKQRIMKENSSLFFLGGYMRNLRENDVEEWEKQIDNLKSDPATRAWVPELVWRSGITEKAILSIIELAHAGHIGLNQLSVFRYGREIPKFKEEQIKELVDILISYNRLHGILLAIDYFAHYYTIHQNTKVFPCDKAYNLLTSDLFVTEGLEKYSGNVDTYYWGELGKIFIRMCPERSIELSEFILSHFGEENIYFQYLISETDDILKAIIQDKPKEVWAIIQKYLGPPIDHRALQIKNWLQDMEDIHPNTSALRFFPPEILWGWVEEDIESRAWYLAYMIPKNLFVDEDKLCLAREMLIKFGDREDVRRNFSANFNSGSYWGLESIHLQTQLDELELFRRKETDSNVLLWINEEIEILKDRIKRAKENEEKGFL